MRRIGVSNKTNQVTSTSYRLFRTLRIDYSKVVDLAEHLQLNLVSERVLATGHYSKTELTTIKKAKSRNVG
jgi:hypothetical protein